ncbi:hypothetical protein EVAR_99997_1 [Eumeta japonica]|uniref:Uncharacterized protein n=1 Tax=Eumeta variegata TaxID=151549 RepID=A0A4C2A6L1_EUMVA|nr:hypothetical protein EVAR_99997_1 [Eumeta japonica]
MVRKFNVRSRVDGDDRTNHTIPALSCGRPSIRSVRRCSHLRHLPSPHSAPVNRRIRCRLIPNGVSTNVEECASGTEKLLMMELGINELGKPEKFFTSLK